MTASDAALRASRRSVARPLLAVAAVLALVSLLFLLAPQLDIAVSRLFYDSAAGFAGERHALIEGVRVMGRLVEWCYALAAFLPYFVKLALPDRPLLISPRATLFIALSYLIGPGLIVNSVLKEFWGRARPRSIEEFGGDAVFSPAWWIVEECERNCSFVSGEAAAAFWLVGLAFLVRKAWRRTALVGSLCFAAAVSATRIVAGGHFVSDVLIAWLITLFVMLVLKRIVLDALPPAFDLWPEERIAAAARAARRLHAGRPRRKNG